MGIKRVTIATILRVKRGESDQDGARRVMRELADARQLYENEMKARTAAVIERDEFERELDRARDALRELEQALRECAVAADQQHPAQVRGEIKRIVQRAIGDLRRDHG